MNTPIDLGHKMDQGLCSAPEPVNPARKWYPSFNYSGSEELDLPKEGTMTIKFCVTREVEEKRDGKEHYSCEIEVKEILEVEGEEEVGAPTKSGTEAGVALDDLARKLISLHDILEKTD